VSEQVIVIQQLLSALS